MASVKRKEKKNGEAVYRIDIFIGYDKSGKKRTKVITFKPSLGLTPKQQEKEANKYAMEYEEKLKRGESFEGEEMTFGTYAEKWLECMKTELAYSTYERYVHIIQQKLIPYFGNFKVARIKTPTVEAFYKTLLENMQMEPFGNLRMYLVECSEQRFGGK